MTSISGSTKSTPNKLQQKKSIKNKINRCRYYNKDTGILKCPGICITSNVNLTMNIYYTRISEFNVHTYSFE